MQNSTPTITIPRSFFDDHVDRDCAVPTVVHETKREVTLAVEPASEGWQDLRSDAEYYATSPGFDPAYRGLCRAAARVLAVMTAAERA